MPPPPKPVGIGGKQLILTSRRPSEKGTSSTRAVWVGVPPCTRSSDAQHAGPAPWTSRVRPSSTGGDAPIEAEIRRVPCFSHASRLTWQPFWLAGSRSAHSGVGAPPAPSTGIAIRRPMPAPDQGVARAEAAGRGQEVVPARRCSTRDRQGMMVGRRFRMRRSAMATHSQPPMPESPTRDTYPPRARLTARRAQMVLPATSARTCAAHAPIASLRTRPSASPQ